MMNEKGYVFRDEKHFGPLEVQEIKELISRGLISTQHNFWQPGMKAWQPLRNFENFKSYENFNYANNTDDEFENVLRADTRFSCARSPQTISIPKPQDFDLNREIGLAGFQYIEKPKAKEREKNLLEWNRITISLVAVVIASALAIVYSVRFGSNNEILSSLNKMQVYELDQVLDMRSSKSSPVARVVSDGRNLKSARLVVATNATKGSVFAVQIEGVPETLVGEHRLKLSFEQVIKKNLFEIKDLRRADGRFLPIGKYNIKMICTNCLNKDERTSYAGSFFWGITAEDKYYKKDLAEYHKKIRERAKTELAELSQIVNVLENQFSSSNASFLQNKGRKKSRKRWERFRTQWMDMQSQITDAFIDVEDPIFYSQLFYGPLYKSLKLVSAPITEANSGQNEIIKSGAHGVSQRSSIEIKKNEIINQLSQANQKIQLMKTYYLNSGGMPPRKGL